MLGLRSKAAFMDEVPGFMPSVVIAAVLKTETNTFDYLYWKRAPFMHASVFGQTARRTVTALVAALT